MSETAGSTSADEASCQKPLGRQRVGTLAFFVLAATLAGATAGGPGLTWDEPAYRWSQTKLQSWLRELTAADGKPWRELFSAEAIHEYWEYNRFGPNFHPPMASYGNLLTYYICNRFADDVIARRLASALLFAGTCTILMSFVGRRWGTPAGWLAGLSLLFSPRVMGDAHVIGTDMPILFFWSATAVCFHNGRHDRRWQIMGALLLACLFLVKFSGAMIVLPIGACWVVGTFVWQSRSVLFRWTCWTLALALPLAPIGAALLAGPAKVNAPPNSASLLSSLGKLALLYPRFSALLLLWPLYVYLLFQRQRRKNPSAFADWSAALEIPWAMLAVAPPTTIALNPTWWHNTIENLAKYFALNLHRSGYLPDIKIFYLGEQYIFTLPWSNAFVLFAVTVPLGVLALGLLGTTRLVCKSAPTGETGLPMWFFSHALTFPLLRMLGTPCHDGVRLFLPTFFFWAGMVGVAGSWVAGRYATSSRRRWVGVWLALFTVGPGWAFWDWVRTHPYELSYYNIGLMRAVDIGFEPTYWYDAVTPTVLDECQRKIPPNTAVIVHVDEKINPEVFVALQQLGKLRPDIELNPRMEAGGIPWAWLLTHSSKATGFTRLLHALPPVYESGHAGVRLFAVVDAEAYATALALHILCVENAQGPRLGVPTLFEPALTATGADLDRVASLLRQHRENARNFVAGENPTVRAIVEHGYTRQTLNPLLARVLAFDSTSLERACGILSARQEDVRRILLSPGYLRPPRHGGYLAPKKTS